MENEKKISLQLDGDPLAETAEPGYALTRCFGRGWLDGAEDERVGEPDLFEGMPCDPALESLDVDGDVGKFRHGLSIIERVRTFRILVGGWILGGLMIVALAATKPAAAPKPAVIAGAEIALDQPAVRQRSILVPVAGVKPEQLRDTFLQARSGGRRHDALDILAPRGTPVLAAVDGTIKKLFNSKAGGVTAYQFDVAEERVYYYAHLEGYAPGLHEGQFVRQGDVIGYVGTTGNAPATTPHLHFAIEVLTAEKVWWKGTAVNPYPLLR
jgi:peptidoglycan LD-endopeptidase LytH